MKRGQTRRERGEGKGEGKGDALPLIKLRQDFFLSSTFVDGQIDFPEAEKKIRVWPKKFPFLGKKAPFSA